MKYVSLQVPQALYLRTLQFIGGEVTGMDASALQAQLAASSETNRMLSQLVGSLRSQLAETDQELWALKEQRQLDRDQAAAADTPVAQENLREARRAAEAEVLQLRAQLEQVDRERRALLEQAARWTRRRAAARDDDYSAEAFDRDDSYPDHGPEDDAAAGMGLPSRTAGTLVEEDRHESPETAPADPTPAEHEAPAEPEPAPAEEPQTQPQAEVPAPAAPRPEPAPAQQPQTTTEVAAAWLDQALVKGRGHDFLYVEDIVARAPAGMTPITVSKVLRRRGLAAFKPVRQSGPKKGVQAVAFKGITWAPAQPAQEQPQEPAKPLTPAERRKADSEALAAMAKAAQVARGRREVNRDGEPEAAPHIEHKPKPAERTPILHVRKPQPGSGVSIVRSDGTVTTVQKFAEELEPEAESLKPEEAPGLAFDIWDDCKNGTNRPYTISDDVMALYGLDRDMVDAAIRNPERVEIRPESKEKGYPVLRFHRGDLDVIAGFRTPERPKVIAAYMRAALEHDVHRVNHAGGGGSKRSVGLPSTVKASVRALQQRGLTVSPEWESATQPVEVRYKDQVLGKMKVHLADRKQVQGDYQRLLRQAHAIDRREEAKVG